ncbi:MAG: magnesium transporter, partial [Alphaproteobacteria bacterium]|nr:magnesium transporter [Alphaproteobacteria bacterium]
MSEREIKPDTAPAADTTAVEDESYALKEQIVEDVSEALAAEEPDRVKEIIEPLHYADVADLVEQLAPEDRDALVDVIKPDFDPEILHELDEEVRDDVIEKLGVENVAAAVSEMDSDDAVSIVEELGEEERKKVLAAIPAEERRVIRDALGYPPDSAGRLMQRELVEVPPQWTVGETIDFMRRTADDENQELPEVFYDIFVVNTEGKPMGAISLCRLLRARRQIPVVEIMDSDMQIIPANMDQEEVAFLFRQRDLVSAPVVDEAGCLVGAITIDDVVDVIQEENEEDFLRLGGIAAGDIYRPIVATTRSRFTWLSVNLATAILASIVIGLFDATISQMVALAILMPIVASMGGNAGTQTLTVVVRAIATKELTTANAVRVIGKEILVGVLNGSLFAVIAGIIAWMWFGGAMLGL